MNVVAATDFRNNFSTYFGQVAFTGEELWIKKGKKTMLKLSKADSNTKKPDIMDLAGLWSYSETKKVKATLKKIRDMDPVPYDFS